MKLHLRPKFETTNNFKKSFNFCSAVAFFTSAKPEYLNVKLRRTKKFDFTILIDPKYRVLRAANLLISIRA